MFLLFILYRFNNVNKIKQKKSYFTNCPNNALTIQQNSNQKAVILDKSGI